MKIEISINDKTNIKDFDLFKIELINQINKIDKNKIVSNFIIY
jgi:hypothetical protein